ncbi:MAG: DoxX family membrane protein [Gemmatimonadales bacterium]|nr:DoxX family membrane protein [Gemmatimonadales bacterium]
MIRENVLNRQGLLVLFCRLVVGCIFIYASLDKMAHPFAFAQNIFHYRLLPMAFLHPIALLLPMAEMILGLGLVLGVARRGSALLAALMTIVFMMAISIALLRGLDISCGCFHTEGGHAVGLSLLLRDVVLLALCLPPLLCRDPGPGLGTFFRPNPK